VRRFSIAITALSLVALMAGCEPEIGDDCDTSTDCSVSGDRICDVASPGGYCTVADCEQDTCPEGAVCVEFRFEPKRLASSWCLAACGDDSDCRSAYSCLHASEIVDRGTGEPIARTLDESGDSARFCAAVDE